MTSHYNETIQQEYNIAKNLPILSIKNEFGTTLSMLRTDLLSGGIKHAIGRGLIARAIDEQQITEHTHAVVVQGAGNTVTAVKQALEEFGYTTDVIAVVYHETSARILERLANHNIQIVAQSPRIAGRDGRSNVVADLCANDPRIVFLDQHNDPTIIDIQERVFGRALVESLPHPATDFIAGVGTGGTLFGIGAALRKTNPYICLVGVEGVGSTLSLWQAYTKAGLTFADKKTAIERTLAAYRNAGMLTALTCHPDCAPEEWFEVGIDFPPDTTGIVGIEGLGVGDPSDLIMSHIEELYEVRIVTDTEAQQGVQVLQENGIRAVESAGANFAAAVPIIVRVGLDMQERHIVTVITAAEEKT